MVQPWVVETQPYPGKSRVPVHCSFDCIKLVSEVGLTPTFLPHTEASCILDDPDKMVRSLRLELSSNRVRADASPSKFRTQKSDILPRLGNAETSCLGRAEMG